MESTITTKRSRDESNEFDSDSPLVKRFRDDLLDLLDDSDVCAPSQDLDNFMKSFEEEISAPALPPVSVIDLTSDSGDSGPELGYLFEASDDELGLPPSDNSMSSSDVKDESDLSRVSYDSRELSELLKFDHEIFDCDSIETGFSYADEFDAGESAAFEGIFDYSDVGFGSSWPTETLPVI